jgi:Holliday junction resolvase RusA-like endonuclease
MASFQFEVKGTPVPQGSPQVFRNKNTDKVYVTHQKGTALREWRDAIAEQAQRHMVEPTMGAVTLRFDFTFPRPAGHYGKKGNLLPSAPAEKTTKPDIDKLIRAAMDALTGVVYRDDAQVTWVATIKRFTVGSGQPHGGVHVTVGYTQ